MRMMGIFSGMGGFEYAAQSVGWEVVAWCEYNPFCQTVLRYYFPDAEGFGDINKTDFSKYANSIDILCGGFPCQPFSFAGKRGGQSDDRYHWPSALRTVRQVGPRWVVFENVTGLTSILEPASLSEMEIQALQQPHEGNVQGESKSEDGDKVQIIWQTLQKRILAKIIDDLIQEGYDFPRHSDGTPIIFVMPACAVNAPHRRDRIWIVAHSTSAASGDQCRAPSDQGWATGQGGTAGIRQGDGAACAGGISPTGAVHEPCTTPDTNSLDRWPGDQPASEQYQRQEASNSGGTSANADGQRLRKQSDGLGKPGQFSQNGEANYWSNFPTQSPVCNGNNGLPARLAGITFSSWRNKAIEACGNAIVPQVAIEIFKAIESADNK